mmetsp:Transcript_112838/g.324277  ORF Transcript_112838/g.324277 Transcript_112838/m.324277 type:complete len:211 (+) Transcript_112838:103-735(+)
MAIGCLACVLELLAAAATDRGRSIVEALAGGRRRRSPVGGPGSVRESVVCLARSPGPRSRRASPAPRAGVQTAACSGSTDGGGLCLHALDGAVLAGRARPGARPPKASGLRPDAVVEGAHAGVLALLRPTLVQPQHRRSQRCGVRRMARADLPLARDPHVRLSAARPPADDRRVAWRSRCSGVASGWRRCVAGAPRLEAAVVRCRRSKRR